MASILIIGPDAAGRKLQPASLRAAGHDVVEADAEEAIQCLQSRDFDIVMTPLQLASGSALDLIPRAKLAAPDAGVIVMTDEGDLKRAIDCVHLGALRILTAPFSDDDVTFAVAHALERRDVGVLVSGAGVGAGLADASRAIFASREPQTLPARIVEAAISVMCADDVSLMLLDEEGKLYIAHSHALSPEVSAVVRVAIGDRVAGRVAETREAVLLNHDVKADGRFGGISSHRRIRSSIVYPLVFGDTVHGVLNITRVENSNPFRRRDMVHASVLAAHIVLALENVRLLRNLVSADRLATVGQLAAGVAHEINNPLFYVLASAGQVRDCLQRVAPNDAALRRAIDDALDALADIEEGTTRIKDIANDLRALARVEDRPRDAIDVNDPIRSALRVARAAIVTRANVTTELGDNLIVSGSEGRLSQVFVNLLVNAAQAIEARGGGGGNIIVRSFKVANEVFVTVADDGPGIPAHQLSRIFDAFFTTKKNTGTGLGLSITKDIVQRHGGELRVESAPGAGATFTVVLPARAMAQPGSAAARASEPDAPSSIRVLFVDDEPGVLRAYSRAFEDDVDVVVAAGGVPALRLLESGGTFDVIVCDLVMPDMTGMDLFRRVAKERPELAAAFVFATGSLRLPAVRQFTASIPNRVLEKPFDFSELRDLFAGLRSDASART